MQQRNLYNLHEFKKALLVDNSIIEENSISQFYMEKFHGN